MRRYVFYFCIATALLLAGCSPAPTNEPATAPPSATAPSSTSGDPLTGMWSGDWGPTPTDRNPVTLELNWDGARLTGIVNPGPNAVTLLNTSFDPATGAITMEASAEGRGGAIVHYMIAGKVEGTTMSGTWNHDNRQGDFRITKS